MAADTCDLENSRCKELDCYSMGKLHKVIEVLVGIFLVVQDNLASKLMLKLVKKEGT